AVRREEVDEVVDLPGRQQLAMRPPMLGLPALPTRALRLLPLLAALGARRRPIARRRPVRVRRVLPELLDERGDLALELREPGILRRQLGPQLGDQLVLADQLRLELGYPALGVHRRR